MMVARETESHFSQILENLQDIHAGTNEFNRKITYRLLTKDEEKIVVNNTMDEQTRKDPQETKSLFQALTIRKLKEISVMMLTCSDNLEGLMEKDIFENSDYSVGSKQELIPLSSETDILNQV